jgi:hypothetical protein
MKIEFDNDSFYELKDKLTVEFLKQDLKDIESDMEYPFIHKADIKFNKKLIKAYKTILKYHGAIDE